MYVPTHSEEGGHGAEGRDHVELKIHVGSCLVLNESCRMLEGSCCMPHDSCYLNAEFMLRAL